MKIFASRKYENCGSIDDMLDAFTTALYNANNINTTTDILASEKTDYLDSLIDFLDSDEEFNYIADFKKTKTELNIYITDFDDNILEFSVPYGDLSFDNIHEDAQYIIDGVNSLMEE